MHVIVIIPMAPEHEGPSSESAARLSLEFLGSCIKYIYCASFCCTSHIFDSTTLRVDPVFADCSAVLKFRSDGNDRSRGNPSLTG